MAINIPFFQKMLNKFYKFLGFIWININNEINILFHMGTNVANTADTINNFPLLSRNIILKLFNRFCKI